MEFPENPKPSEDKMVNTVKTLAPVLGSEEEAKKKIYSVSTHTHTGCGALISEELSYKVNGCSKLTQGGRRGRLEAFSYRNCLQIIDIKEVLMNGGLGRLPRKLQVASEESAAATTNTK